MVCGRLFVRLMGGNIYSFVNGMQKRDVESKVDERMSGWIGWWVELHGGEYMSGMDESLNWLLGDRT